MLTAIVIMTIVAIICIVAAVKTGDGDSGINYLFGFVAGVLLLAAFIMIFFIIKFNIGSQNLTGYIYDRSEQVGYVTYDLRYSQNAGTDNQPNFCVKAGSDEDNKLSALVGQNTKVSVTVPSSNFKLVQNPFECSTFAVLNKTIDSTTQPLEQ